MCVCVRACVRTCVRTCVRAYVRAYVRTYMYIFVRVNVNIRDVYICECTRVAKNNNIIFFLNYAYRLKDDVG